MPRAAQRWATRATASSSSEAQKFNIIGTDGDGIGDATEWNLISGNLVDGVGIGDAGTDSNVVAGNFIGTNLTGTAAIPNQLNGLVILRGSRSNVIGTDGDGSSDLIERNFISGNALNGVTINGSGTNSNVLAGNYVGVNVNGAALPNGRDGNFGDGVEISGGARFNIIGTDGNGIGDVFEGNVVSGNQYAGIVLQDNGTENNIVAGNRVGTSPDGNAAIPNGRPGNLGDGVVLYTGARFNIIGTDGNGTGDVAERNIISGNAYTGIRLVGASSNTIAGNYIGTNVDGAAAVPNAVHGILVMQGAQGTRIGTDGNGVGDVAERNVIAGNSGLGVIINGSGTNNTVLAGNYIGLNAAGTAALVPVTEFAWQPGVLVEAGTRTPASAPTATGRETRPNETLSPATPRTASSSGTRGPTGRSSRAT